MADTGKAWPLVEGTGRIYGAWVIESLSETRTVFFRDGAARRIEFTLTLKRIDDGRVDLLGTAISSAGNILRGLL
ncbi:Phage P2 GpU [compost metagenome]